MAFLSLLSYDWFIAEDEDGWPVTMLRTSSKCRGCNVGFDINCCKDGFLSDS